MKPTSPQQGSVDSFLVMKNDRVAIPQLLQLHRGMLSCLLLMDIECQLDTWLKHNKRRVCFCIYALPRNVILQERFNWWLACIGASCLIVLSLLLNNAHVHAYLVLLMVIQSEVEGCSRVTWGGIA